MIAIQPTPTTRAMLFVLLTCGMTDCAASHAGSRELAHYPAIDLAAPLPYNTIGVYVVNSTGEYPVLALRDSIEVRLTSCLKAQRVRVALHRVAADTVDIHWRPHREADDADGVAIAKKMAVRGVLLVHVLEIRGSLLGGATMAMDARLVDRDAGSAVWARKVGPIDTPDLMVPGSNAFVSTGSGTKADRLFTASVCQMLETLRWR